MRNFEYSFISSKILYIKINFSIKNIKNLYIHIKIIVLINKTLCSYLNKILLKIIIILKSIHHTQYALNQKKTKFLKPLQNKTHLISFNIALTYCTYCKIGTNLSHSILSKFFIRSPHATIKHLFQPRQSHHLVFILHKLIPLIPSSLPLLIEFA